MNISDTRHRLFIILLLCHPLDAQAEDTAAKPTSQDRSYTLKSFSFNMKAIPAGHFKMGSRYPKTKIDMPAYYMMETEVTFALWDACRLDGGCAHTPRNRYSGRGEYPVGNVSWHDISQSFIPWLKAKTGVTFSLPTEYQWEYAATADSNTLYGWGDKADCSKARFNGGKDSTCDAGGPMKGFRGPATVKSYPANKWGMYDMVGNVREWTSDCWMLSSSEERDDNGEKSCGLIVIRDGDWATPIKRLRSLGYFTFMPKDRFAYVGFRLVHSLSNGKPTATIPYTVGDVEFIMKAIPAGKTLNRGAYGQETEKPVHSVTLKPYYLMETEVTWQMYQPCIDAGECPVPKFTYEEQDWGRGSKPVVNVGLKEITKHYIPWLNQQTGKTFRLPSESEWEYAARAGTTTAYHWGNDIDCDMATYGRSKLYSAKQCNKQGSTAVKSYPPNAFGLYDMHGNVSELLQDCWSRNYIGAPSDGSVRLKAYTCELKLVRGGSWADSDVRSANRITQRPSTIFNNNQTGFRLAQDL
ncbi:MAG: SUMF1/EgtB/PvdO family nonheme iron enzyme [Algicola sp.]|nr:SUMF1/EgtB/PvdO family nonheme iron enzyme [Algicola sp.]